MGKPNQISLEQDRAFDVESMNELLELGKSILDNAISISEKVETSIRNISDVYYDINGAYQVSALGNDITNMSGKMVKECFQDTIDRMCKLLTKLINDMPYYDTELAQSVESLQDVIYSLQGRVEDLKSLLETDAATLNHKDFRQRLIDLKAEWNTDTEDLRVQLEEIENEMLGVCAPAVQYSCDPVNLSTGNFVYDHEDMKVGGEIPLTFHRYYNAKDRAKGSLGRCFRHNYEIWLTENIENGKVTVCMGDGQRKTFYKNEDGIYLGRYSSGEVLKEEERGYIMTKFNGERYIFDKKGYIVRIENSNGRGICFTYDENDLLANAEADNGSSFDYEYDEKGQLAKVKDHTGRTVTLSYERKKLCTVCTPQGSIYKYTYATNGRIEEAVNTRGNIAVKNTYDDKFRVINQSFPDGGTMAFAYDDSKRQVILIERNGSKITYVHDGKYRNTDILYEDGTSEHFEYNKRNQKVLYVDRNGNSTRMAYDEKGNLTQAINALGDKVNLTYNANNKLLCVKINGNEKLHNTYDSNGNITSSIGADGNGNKVTYDEAGRPIHIESADESITRIKYNDKGNITEILSATGARTLYEYDELNRVIQTIDGNGNPTGYEYDCADRICKVTNALGEEREYSYDESGNLIKVKDFDGYQVCTEYNVLNKPQRITDKEGNVTSYSYDLMWNLSYVKQADGSQHSYIYDKNNRLKEEKLPGGGSICYAYDGNGNCISVTDAEGNITRNKYNALNKVVETCDAQGGITLYEYDSEGNIIRVTDANGNDTFYAYDGMGRPIEMRDALGNKTFYNYNAIGKLEKIIYPNHTEESYMYVNGELKEVHLSNGDSIRYEYDANGNVVSVTNGAGEEIQLTYNALNRVISIAGNEGVRKFDYDRAGNLKRIIDEVGNQTSYEHSPNGNLIRVTDAIGNQTSYEYDGVGHLTRIIQEEYTDSTKKHITSYEWDLSGQVVKVVDPLGDIERYAYNRNGKMTDKWDKDGYHTAYAYGSTGDLEGVYYGDGRSVSLSYDALHRLKKVQDWDGITEITSDALGRTLSVLEPDGRKIAYEWGYDGRKSVTYPNGERAEYQYNEKGQLSKLHTEQGCIQYQYDDLGNLIRKELPNGIVTSYSYNLLGRIREINHTGKDFAEQYSYQYDALGNKVSIDKKRYGFEADSGHFEYGYDALNRLTSVRRDGSMLREYSYDGFGNRITKKEYVNGAARTIDYTYNVKNQLLTETDGLTEKQYHYDHRGNMIRMSIGEKLMKQFTFDASNRMTKAMSVTDDIVKKACYRYNGLGQRIGQEIWSKKTESASQYDLTPESVLPECPDKHIRYTVDQTKEYHNLLSIENDNVTQLFFWDNNVVMMEEEGNANYYIQDVLGSPMHLMDMDGNSRESYGYDEFGLPIYNDLWVEQQSFSPNSKNAFRTELQPFGFTGYQMDEAGSLYFAQARRYDTQTGRFVSEDIVKGSIEAPFTLNSYTYCWNRPLDFVDLNGKWPEWVETTAKVFGFINLIKCAVFLIVFTYLAPGIGTMIFSIALAGTISALIGGFANESSGGSFLNGYIGSFVSGTTQAGLMTIHPALGIPGGGANYWGTLLTDVLDNLDNTNEKHKTWEEIFDSAKMNGWLGIVYSIPSVLVSWMVGYANNNPEFFVELDYSYSEGQGEIMNQTFGILDNLLVVFTSAAQEGKE